MVLFLLDKLNISNSDPTSRQPTPGSRAKTPASARSTKTPASARRAERSEPRGGQNKADTEPRWQVAVEKPRFI